MAEGRAGRIGGESWSTDPRTRLAAGLTRLRSIWSGLFGSASDYVLVVALVVLGARNFVSNLGATSLIAWDEGIYANAAKHVVAEGYWLVPHVDGYAPTGRGMGPEPFLEKPPLVFWLQGLTMEVLGVNEFAARFQSAAFAVLTAVLLYLVGREVIDRRTGFLAGVVYLTIPMLFTAVNGPTAAGTDMAVIFFGSLATFLVWRGVRAEETRWLLYASLPAVGAVMAKGFDAGVWVVVLLPLLLLNPWVLFSRDLARAVGIVVPAVAVWPLVAWTRYGDEFVNTIFHEQVWMRVQGETGVEVDGALFDAMRYPFFREFPVVLDPWAYLLVPAVVAVPVAYWRRGDHSETRAFLFVAWWFACIVGIYAFLGGTHTGYVLKAYVPAALLVGWVLRDATEGEGYARVVLLGSVGLTVAFSPRTEELSPLTYLPSTPETYVPGHPLRGWGFVVLVAVAVGFLLSYPVLASWIRDRVPDRGRLVGTTIAAALVVVLAVALVGSPAIAEHQTSPYEELGGVMDRETPEGATVYVTTGALAERGDNYAHVGFYSDRRMARLPAPGESLADPDVRYVVATADEFEGIDPSRYRVIHRFESRYDSEWDVPWEEMVFVEILPQE